MAGKSVELNIDVDPVVNATRHDMAKRLNKAGQHVRNVLVRKLSSPWPPASTPGEMPHARTGKLRQSINVRRATADNLHCEVGTSLRYGAYLEIGTKKMAARPFLRRTILEEAANIRKIIATDPE